MKKVKFLAMLLAAFTLSFAFTACGDDDDDNGGGNNGTPALVGSWLSDRNFKEIFEPDPNTGYMGGRMETITTLVFESNGKASQLDLHNNDQNDGSYNHEKHNMYGTYRTDGDKLFITYTKMYVEWESAWYNDGKLEKESEKRDESYEEPFTDEFIYSVQGKKLTLIQKWLDYEGNVLSDTITYTKQ